MEILFFGDAHIRENNEYSKKEPDGFTTLLHECMDSLAWVTSIIEENGEDIDAVVNLGDLFDDTGAVKGVNLFVAHAAITSVSEACKKHNIPFVSLVGNHEWVVNGKIHTVPFLKDKGILHTSVKVETTAGAPILFVPHSTDFVRLRKEMWDYCSEQENKGHRPIIVSHLDVVGCAYDSGGVCNKGIELENISRAVMINGHHHRPQVIKSPNYPGTILNAGSLMYKDFKDQYDPDGNERGVLLLEVDQDLTKDIRHMWIPNPVTSVFYTIRTSSIDDMWQQIADVYPNNKMNLRIVSTKALDEGEIPKEDFQNVKLMSQKVKMDLRIDFGEEYSPDYIWEKYLSTVEPPDGISMDIIKEVGEHILTEAGTQVQSANYQDVTILEWGAQNFLSVDNAKIVTPESKKVVVVLGDNRDTSSTDSNGSGKSSIFEVLPFTLWGEIVRGKWRQIDDVISTTNPDAGAYTYVKLLIGETEYTVVRKRKWDGRKDNLQLFIDGADESMDRMPETQKEINRLLGMTFEEYKQLVHLSGNNHFTDIKTDPAKKAFLDTVIGTSIYSIAEVIAARTAKQLEQEKEGLEEGIYDAEVSISQWERDIANFRHMREENKKQADLRVQNFQTQIGVAEGARGVVASNLADAERKSEEHARELTTVRAKMEQRKTKIERLQIAIADKTARATVLMDDYNMKQELTRAGICDKCGAKVQKQKYHERMADINTEVKTLKDSVAKLDKACKSFQRDHLGFEDVFKEVMQRRMAAQRLVGELQSKLSNEDQKIKNLQKEIESVKNEEDIFEPQINKRNRLIESEKVKLEQLRVDLKSAIDSLMVASFVAEQFSPTKLRSYVLDYAIVQGNQLLVELAGTFSNNDIGVQISPTKAQKSNVVSKIDFETTLNSPVFELSSSGEKKRMDLMIQFALSVLSRRYRNGFNIMIIDEEDAGLDATGLEYFIQVLNSLSQTSFLVSHQQKMQSAGEITMMAVREGGRTSYIFDGAEAETCQTL